VGEALHVYRDSSASDRQVCELCRDRALQRGLEPVGPIDSPRLRVQPSGSVSDIVDRDRLIEGLGNELNYLRRQLGERNASLTEASGIDDEALRAITDRLRRQDRELEQLRRDNNPAAQAQMHRAKRQLETEVRDLRAQLGQRDAEIARLKWARAVELDPVRMRSFALEAFNGSEHSDRMARIARTLGDPVVSVLDDGPAVPRKLTLTLSWDIAWYEFLVKLDLGTNRASIKEIGTGGDSRDLAPSQLRANARWRDSGLVLA
jgi:hypothetical protein